MTKEDLYPKLPNQVIVILEDGSKFKYDVDDEAVVGILNILIDAHAYLPCGALKSGDLS